MSSTSYLATPAGHATFTGTSPVSVFATAPANLTDADVSDVLQIRSTGALLWTTPGEMIECVARLRANGTTIHTMQFGAIGGDDDARDVTLEYWLTLTASSTCRVEGNGTISGAGGQGPNRADRNPVTRAQAFALPVTFDLTVQLDEATAHYTPDSSFLHKVEPTLSTGAPSASPVTSVNTQTGDVVLTALGILATPFIYLPRGQSLYNTSGPNVGKYSARPHEYEIPVEYVGPNEPTVANTLVPSFHEVDFWTRTV